MGSKASNEVQVVKLTATIKTVEYSKHRKCYGFIKNALEVDVSETARKKPESETEPTFFSALLNKYRDV